VTRGKIENIVIITHLVITPPRYRFRMCFRPVDTPEPEDERAATLDTLLPGVSITRYVAVSSFGPRFTTMSVRVPPAALGMLSTRGFGVATSDRMAN
jgi:hypothetical protein